MLLNDFLSGKRSYVSKPGELKKVDMEQRAKEQAKKKQEKVEEKRKEKAKEIER